MRAPLTLIASCALGALGALGGFGASLAQAGNRIVVFADATGDDLRPALEVALASHGVEVASLPAPDGARRLDRAAAASRAAEASGADAGVWIDEDTTGTEVCVVSADGTRLRHTQVPAEPPPRVFAAIAASLLDELLAPPEPAIAVDVHVDVEAHQARAEQLPPRASVPALSIPAAAGDPSPLNGPLAEIALTASPATVGVEVELSFAVAPAWRLGVLGGAQQLVDGIDDVIFQLKSGSRMFDAGGELRHVGQGQVHFDLGIAGGAVWSPATEVQIGGFAAIRLSVTRESAGSSVSLALAPTFVLGLGGDKTVIPGALASLRWGSRI